jgi:hypothetical protein
MELLAKSLHSEALHIHCQIQPLRYVHLFRFNHRKEKK